MKIEVKIIKENKDGSANAQVEFDKQGLEVLVQWGAVAMLTKAIDEYAIRPEEDGDSPVARIRAVTKKKPSKKSKPRLKNEQGKHLLPRS
jgi:hypothetical protein